MHMYMCMCMRLQAWGRRLVSRFSSHQLELRGLGLASALRAPLLLGLLRHGQLRGVHDLALLGAPEGEAALVHGEDDVAAQQDGTAHGRGDRGAVLLLEDGILLAH